MEYLILCGAVFIGACLINLTYISVFYHRGLTHGAVVLNPGVQKFVAATGPWVMGIDAKTWTCMHRLHHQHSDTELDPHSPSNSNILMVAYEQLRSYEKIMKYLIMGRKSYTSVVADLDFPVHWLFTKKLWWLPYALHLAVAIGIGVVFNAWLLGLCFFIGMMSHPFEGWLVNSFGHSIGYQNFDNKDDSRNNTLVAWFVLGEGYQNNHHMFPRSPKFSLKWWEIDPGYPVCNFLEMMGVLKIDRTHMISEISEKKVLVS